MVSSNGKENLVLGFYSGFVEGLISTPFAGFLLKKSTKNSGWSKRWFVLNEKTGKVSPFMCLLFHLVIVIAEY